MNAVPTLGLHLGPPLADSLAASQRAARRVSGDRYGIVADCQPVASPDGLADLTIFVARGPRHMPGWPLWSCPEGAGISPDPESARLAAIAETIEQYCSMAPPDARHLVRAKFSELGDAAVSPCSFAGLSARQRRKVTGLVPLGEQRTLDWTPAYSLTERRGRLVPAALVNSCLGGAPPNDFAPEFVSTGFACHVSTAQAVLHGLCEVLERDALAIAWHNRLPLIPLDLDGTEVDGVLVGLIKGSGAQFRLLQVPTDAPFPVIVAMATSDEGEPDAVFGAACRPSPIGAALRALYETCQILSWCRRARPARPDRLRTMGDHAAFFAGAEGARLLDRHLVISSRRRHLSEVATAGRGEARADLQAATGALAQESLEVLVAEVTTADVAEAGFRVVRVLVPGMVNICANPRFAQLGAPRLYQLPVRLGVRDAPLPERSLNLLPVPLA